MCIANYEPSGSQVQLTLERGLPAMIASFTSKQLPFPSLSFDMLHCASGIDWDQKGIFQLSIYASFLLGHQHASVVFCIVLVQHKLFVDYLDDASYIISLWKKYLVVIQ